MLHSGMNEFIAAIYRQHQNAAYMNAAYLESYKELAKLQAQHEQAITNEHLRRLESCEKIRDVESSKKRKDSKVNNICILCAAFFLLAILIFACSGRGDTHARKKTSWPWPWPSLHDSVYKCRRVINIYDIWRRLFFIYAEWQFLAIFSPPSAYKQSDGATRPGPKTNIYNIFVFGSGGAAAEAETP